EALAPDFVSIAISLLASCGPPAGPTRRRPVFLDAGGDLAGLVRLQDLLAGLTGADPDRVLDGQDEDLAVADLAGPRVLQDRLGDDPHVLVVDHYLELHLRPEMDGQLRP